MLYNVFERGPLTRMLVYKLYDYLEYLKPFLILLNYWPDRVDGIGMDGEIILDTDIGVDEGIIERLRKI